MLRGLWPLNIFAPNLRPSDTGLDKYEINSINTNNGSNPKGQPDGTNNEKNFNECIWRPKIVAPITIVKLIENVNTKCDIGAKLYNKNNT